jgi:hypothetical protein
VPTSEADRSAAARLVVVALAIAAAVALLVAQHLKEHKALLNSAVWRPAAAPFDPGAGPATVSFKPYYNDTLTVSVVRNGRLVAVIARDYRDHANHRTATFKWPGATQAGTLAPPGYYYVQVHFARLDRTTLVPSVRFQIK